MGRIKKYLEPLFVTLVIFLAIFLTKFPTLHNALNTPPDLFFTKQVVWFDAWDINAYVSFLRYGQRHGVLLENTYTTVPHKKVFVFQTYTLLGVLNRWLKLDPFILFHIFSIIINISLILMIYYAVRTVFQKPIERLSALAVAVLGGGLGWINQFFYSADFRLAGFTLVDPLERPHNALTTLFVVAQVAFLGQFINLGKSKYLFFSLLSAFIAFTIHPPLGLYSVLVLLVSFLVFMKKINKKKFMIGLSALLLFYFVYYVLILKSFLFNPGFKNTGQMIWLPDMPTYVLGFGILTIGMFLTFFSKNKKPLVKLMMIVFLIHIILSFIPFGFQLYYVKGIFIWGVILGFYGFKNVFPIRYLPFILVFLVLFSLPFRIKVFNKLINADYNIQYYFLDKREGRALNFMVSLPPDSSVLSLYRLGNVIPAFTDNRVYLGHQFLTPDYEEKLKLAEKFYLTDERDFQSSFIKDNHLDFIYVGVEEQLLRKINNLPSFVPPDFLGPVYKNDLISIYKVIPI